MAKKRSNMKKKKKQYEKKLFETLKGDKKSE